MPSSRRRKIRLRLRFSDRLEAGPALRELDHDPLLSVSILRGRITREDAWYDLAVTGTARGIRNLLRRGDAWGAAPGSFSAGTGGPGNAP